MLILVFSDNFLMMFVGWEGVGLASFLLIGFWFDRRDDSYGYYADAGKKAFLVNRVGDFGFIVAMLVIWSILGTLNFVPVNEAAEHGAFTLVAANAICLLLLLAATGKSAQIPLFVWLPDAMAGPTPVSALIHAATMVTAGIYMIARTHALWHVAVDVSMLAAWIGGLTAFFAATLAIVQVDLKKILAYSTISQLGFMMMGVGVGAYGAAMFLLLAHAFYKALLFLGAGSVMHATGGELDIRKMGGLRHKMPSTWRTFMIGAAALAGIPPLAGFFAKDAVFLGALQSNLAALRHCAGHRRTNRRLQLPRPVCHLPRRTPRPGAVRSRTREPNRDDGAAVDTGDSLHLRRRHQPALSAHVGEMAGAGSRRARRAKPHPGVGRDHVEFPGGNHRLPHRLCQVPE